MTQFNDLHGECDILVLGSRGRIGRMLRGFATREAAGDMVMPSLAWQSRRGGKGLIGWTPGDPAPLRARTILALWGVTSGTQTALAANAALAWEALDLALKTGATRVVHVSSAAVYGPASAAGEDSPLQPVTAYGQAKQEMEQAIAVWHQSHPGAPVRSTILRLANLAGADMLFTNLDKGAPMLLDRFPDGRAARRSYLAPRDLLGLVCRLHQRAQALPPVLNVAGPRALGMDDILNAARHPFTWRAAPSRALQEVQMECDRLHRLTGPLPDSSRATALVAQWQAARQFRALDRLGAPDTDDQETQVIDIAQPLPPTAYRRQPGLQDSLP